MTDFAITSAFATPIAWVTATEDLTVKVGSTSYPISIPTGTWRILLGFGSALAAAEPYGDLLQNIAAQLNAAGTGLTWTCTLSPTTGLVTLAASGAFTLTSITGALKALLGGLPPRVGVTAVTAPNTPQHLCLLASVSGEDVLNLSTPGAYVPVADGTVVGLSSGVVTDSRAVTLDYVPSSVDLAAALPTIVTPAFPAPSAGAAAVRAALGTGLPWTWADALAAARTRTCGFAIDAFAGLCSGVASGDTYHIVTISEEAHTASRWKRKQPSYPLWLTWADWRFTRLASVPFSTRS